MNLTFVNNSTMAMSKKHMISVLLIIKKKLKLKNQLLTIVFLDPKQARKLNKQFRGKDYATDVLSFQGDVSENELGELVLCPQILKKQAKEHKLSFKNELTYMIIHGVLHLLGYEHENKPTQAKKMFKIQDKIFTELIDKKKT